MRYWFFRGALFFLLLFCFRVSVYAAESPSVLNEKIGREVHALIKQINPLMKVGISVVSLDTGDSLYSHNANDDFVPASNLKLFTAESALLYQKLGPNYRFITRFYLKDNDVYLQSDGDPSLTALDLKRMVAELKYKLKRKGITRLNHVYLDNSKFTRDIWGAGWMIHGQVPCYSAASTDLVINQNCNRGVAIRNITGYVTNLLLNDFAHEGIHVADGIEDGTVPEDLNTPIVEHQSATLAQLMRHMLKVSDNVYANSFFKKLGQKFFGEQGSWFSGEQAVKSIWSENIGMKSDQFKAVDGSGLSRLTRVSPTEIVKLLSFAHDHRYFKYFYNALPVAGVDGTLARRMMGGDIRGKVHAKTGSMSGVSSLSGYVLTHNDHLLAFSIIINNFTGPLTPYRGFEDRLVTYLSKLDVA